MPPRKPGARTAAKPGARKPGTGTKPGARSRGSDSREAPRTVGGNRPSIVVTPEPLEDFNESINILVHGHSGVGKTVLAGGVSNATYLSTEKGVVAAKWAGSKAELIRAPDWQHVEAGLDWADANLSLDDWLIVDSATKMQILMIRDILGLIHEENESRSLDIPAIADHQAWQNGFMRFTDRIIDAQYNSIIVCTSMMKEDPEGESLVLPNITGKDYTISNFVSAQADCVFYYGVAPSKGRDDPTVRRILTEMYPPYFAKSRFGDLLPRWIDVEQGDYTVMDRITRSILAGEPFDE